jgi:ATP-dependent protease ClpP protease subunit
VSSEVRSIFSGSEEQILRDLDRDFYMTPEAAREYGIVDTVLEANGRGSI